MNPKNLIQIKQFCLYHEIDHSFIKELNNYGLVEIITLEEEDYIQTEQLASIEKMIRMHYELKINLEGIDAIAHLLDKIEVLRQNLIAAENKLRLFQGYPLESKQ